MRPRRTPAPAPPPRRLLPAIVAGLLAGAILVMDAITMAALIFKGPLETGLPVAIELALVSTALVCAIIAWRSSFRDSLATLQDSTGILLSSVAAGVVTAGWSRPEDALLTVVVAVGGATALTGGFLYLLGRLRLGRLVRFIPYPVVGGFLAGTGVLIVDAALDVVLGPLAEQPLVELATARGGLLLVPGVVLAALLLLLPRFKDHYLLMPGLLGGALLLFYGVVGLGPWSLADAGASGLLLGGVGEGSLSGALGALVDGEIRWSIIGAQWPSLVALLHVAAVSVLLNATAVEIAARCDMDMDQELRATGLANVAAGALGGFIGFHGISLSSLRQRMNASGPVMVVVSVGVLVAAAVGGTALFALLPRSVVGGVLLYLGLSFLMEWLYDGRARLSRLDYGLVWLIMCAIALWDFLPGVAVGMLVALVLFTLRYSQIDFVKHALTRVDHRSQVERPPRVDQLLAQRGDQIQILCLQGYLFFGAAHALFERIRERLQQPGTRIRYYVIDFRLTSGLDSSAAMSLSKVHGLARDHGVLLVFTGLSAELTRQLEIGGCPTHDLVTSCSFPDLDHGLEWAEDRLLDDIMAEDTATVALRRPRNPLHHFAHPELVRRLEPSLERLELPAGATLFQEGQLADGLYFVTSGEITVWMRLLDGERRRLAQVGPGNVVGEISYLRFERHTAMAVADLPCQLLRLDRRALDQLKSTDPALALEIEEWLLSVVAGRLSTLQQTLRLVLH